MDPRQQSTTGLSWLVCTRQSPCNYQSFERGFCPSLKFTQFKREYTIANRRYFGEIFSSDWICSRYRQGTYFLTCYRYRSGCHRMNRGNNPSRARNAQSAAWTIASVQSDGEQWRRTKLRLTHFIGKLWLSLAFSIDKLKPECRYLWILSAFPFPITIPGHLLTHVSPS